MTASALLALYISDLDGTLLQADARLSQHSRSSIQRMMKSGILFTVATARSMTSTREILGDLPFDLPVICSNGGSIYNYQTQEPLHIELIPHAVIAELIHDMKEQDDTAFISLNIHGAEKVCYDGIPNAGMRWYHNDRVAVNDQRLTLIDDIRELIDQPVTTITFMDRLPRIEKFKDYFSKHYQGKIRMNYFENKYSPGWYWLSLHSPLSTKANAIVRLLDITGLNDRELVVFGDELNDIPMFEKADRAIAVSNALPIVLERAHETIGGNHEDAVVNYILRQNNMA